MHSYRSRVVPNHLPDRRTSFSTTLHAQIKFREIFEKSKFRPQDRFFGILAVSKPKKAVYERRADKKTDLTMQFQMQPT